MSDKDSISETELPFEERVRNANSAQDLIGLSNEASRDFLSKEGPLVDRYRALKGTENDEAERIQRQIAELAEDLRSKMATLDTRMLGLFPHVESAVKVSLTFQDGNLGNRFIRWWSSAKASQKGK